MVSLSQIDYRPAFPDSYRPKIGIIGVGQIVRNQHLRAYAKYSVPVGGVYDINPAAISAAQAEYDIGTVYPSLDALLSEPAIEVVDVATHPLDRVDIILRALAAGKHVLAQKPLALSAAGAQRVIDAAAAHGLKLAVNQNGRWTPPWRIATRLAEMGVIGDVFSVTHLFDVDFSWLTGTIYDAIPHWLFYDYAIHWFDITRCWLGNRTVKAIRAREYRTPNQPAESRANWAGWVEIEYDDGANAMLRSVGRSQSVHDGHTFWVHGTRGTVHGSVLVNEYVTLETDGSITRYQPDGAWFPDGFAGAMGELLSAIADDREPYHSARHNLLSLQMTLAACRSAELDGAPVNPVGLDYSFEKMT